MSAALPPTDLPSDELLDVSPDYLPGPEVAALLRDAQFWSAFLNLAFMPQASELDGALIAEATGLDDAKGLAWWNELSGYYEGVFQESDGYVERPRTLRVRFEAGRQLEIQFHPGAIIYEMRGRDGVAESLAELSGNWVLPGLTWSEAELLASAAQRHGGVPHAAAILLLLPLGYPYEQADLTKIEEMVGTSIAELGFAPADGAPRLAAAWRRDAEGRRTGSAE